MTRRRWILLIAGVGLLSLLFLGSWARPGPSSTMCASCHVIEPAAASAAVSVHADVPCLACHRRAGIWGAATYMPVLATEIVENLTGWPVMLTDLKARPCEACHQEVKATALLEGDHPGPESECASCHGNVAHPETADTAPEGREHPLGFDLTHGRDAAPNVGVCTECHQTDFCAACHTQGSYPHGMDWISTHGQAQIKEGSLGCSMCHPSSFCSSCHGTDIPHADDWLGTHHRAVEGAQVFACGTCHPSDECTQCHSRHFVHREQSIYEWELHP